MYGLYKRRQFDVCGCQHSDLKWNEVLRVIRRRLHAFYTFLDLPIKKNSEILDKFRDDEAMLLRNSTRINSQISQRSRNRTHFQSTNRFCIDKKESRLKTR